MSINNCFQNSNYVSLNNCFQNSNYVLQSFFLLDEPQICVLSLRFFFEARGAKNFYGNIYYLNNNEKQIKVHLKNYNNYIDSYSIYIIVYNDINKLENYYKIPGNKYNSLTDTLENYNTCVIITVSPAMDEDTRMKDGMIGTYIFLKNNNEIKNKKLFEQLGNKKNFIKPDLITRKVKELFKQIEHYHNNIYKPDAVAKRGVNRGGKGEVDLFGVTDAQSDVNQKSLKKMSTIIKKLLKINLNIKQTAKPATKPKAKPVAKPKAKPVAKPTAKPKAKPVAKPKAKPVAKPKAKPKAKK